MDKQSVIFYTKEFSKIYSISHALWRIFEAAELKEYPLQYPLLDLGCGDGLFFKTFLTGMESASRGLIYGIDANEEECRRAREKNIYTEVTCGSANHIPLFDASVKMVFSNSVMEHLENLEIVVGEVSRVLIPNGQFLFTVVSNTIGEDYFFTCILRKLGLPGLAKWYSDRVNQVFKNHHCLSIEAWKDILAAKGLTMVKFEYSIAPRTGMLFDLFLAPSFIQQWYRKTFDKRIPWPRLNHWIINYLVQKCFMAETQAMRGANWLILAKKT